ncbi:MAG: hypothetical protein V2J42_01625 [Wenzhouxiangella sp.]|jgi:hypothetical protein|nr:hypothetical protein [Wenzhouxiangella sp.]
MVRKAWVIGRIRQRPVHGPGRRLLNWARSRLLSGVGKAQQAYFVSINGHRYKRVVFGDSVQALEVASALESCCDCVGLPEIVLAQEAEIWVRFVEGRKVDSGSNTDWQALNDFFAGLYARGPWQVALAETPLHRRLEIDLEFLRDSGVLDQARYGLLQDRAEQLKPDKIWLGYDYVDPVLKNFVVNDQGLFAIDIESLQKGVALGTGVAKASLHWLGDDWPRFLARLERQPGVPALAGQQPYVALCFLAGWTKRKLLTGKWSRVKAENFDRLAGIEVDSADSH